MFMSKSGRTNAATAPQTGGGEAGVASGRWSTVGGGSSNNAVSTFGTVSGGAGNRASGFASTVPGGQASVAAGDWSLAAGRRALANHKGAMVFVEERDRCFRVLERLDVVFVRVHAELRLDHPPELALQGSTRNP